MVGGCISLPGYSAALAVQAGWAINAESEKGVNLSGVADVHFCQQVAGFPSSHETSEVEFRWIWSIWILWVGYLRVRVFGLA